MMSNLFSIFDTNTNSIIDWNWSSIFSNLMMLPNIYWMLQSKFFTLYHKINLILINEFKIILKNKFNNFNLIYFVSLFMLILINNFMGLFPYIFTSSSHMIFSICLTIPFWISLMIFGWLNNTNFMFSHLIPQGTPLVLMPFMVLIETISNVIRPGTLTIRLTANMIAGHLLLTLLSQSASNSSLISICLTIVMIQIILLILEFSVSVIQAYVFSILTVLYTKETN
uniref:ATP synthase F0 subunit 6 n=1 Tax=Gotra octocincta TaxID=3029099 RepID=UPI0023D7C77E|nr:ATP synthase F0 subunit 6 [Gotra octocincta]WDQ40355.1 ATP synthase F0 subunit 6 [Gotra octocincta]